MQIGAQRQFEAHGIKGECGHISFSPNSDTVEVPVGIRTIFSAIGALDGALPIMGQVTCTCDRKVVDGKLTFKRHGGYICDAPTMNYQILGW